jgi:hypothetical protein
MRRAVVVLATLAIPVVVVVALAFGLAGCGGDGVEPTPTETTTVTATPTVSPTPSASPSGTTTVSVYLLRGETLGVAHRKVPATPAVATAAMTALLEGPNAREKAAGLTTAIPAGTTLNGVTIEDGTARVDLSDDYASGGGSLSMQARVAQVVYTLTQFRSVKRVDFWIDGGLVETLGGEGLDLSAGQTRADWLSMLPAIFVETPAVGDVITASPLKVSGSASVYEATFVAQVVTPSGQIVVDQTVNATEGAPGRGDFAVRLDMPVAAGKGKLVVFEVSMEDGARMNEVRIPLRFAIEE